MPRLAHAPVDAFTPRWFALIGGLTGLVLAGLGAAWHIEHNGHWVTGMTNQVVWGLPHVFAVFLIVAASGALNLASIGSVFGRAAYKPLARLSGLLAVALLAGGLAVLVLDLGRPERLGVAMTQFNFRSIFAWNVILYSGFVAVVAIYLWTLMDRRVSRRGAAVAAHTAFVWRLVLTTGTGSIFGFLVAREAYAAAVMAPLFIAMSFALGLAVFVLVLMASCGWSGRPLGDATLHRLGRLLGLFIGVVLYFVVVQHLTNLYLAERQGVERFLLFAGGIHTLLFWAVQIGLGSVVPLLLLHHPRLAGRRRALALAAALTILGGLAQLYVIIIGGQAYPLEIFPGYEVISSGFFDGQVASYRPSLAELLLGLGGVGIALAVVAVAASVLPFLPESLADDADISPSS